ncbi:MAG: peptide deformylase [Pseudozobellia sp.]|nr:peptide deformylase [Pseudozobellia sp.]MBG49911.1 peptide deformylase [Pseudozobellia sp.]MBG50016.1 peptide deformylase [Pseudozobellia sp.]|tara:strand:+ start:696718 stop:697257 length:540 start_codon:yes stop_codon:yes gene_type:complete
MASLEVIRMGNPNLRKVCETVEIEEIQRPEFQTFLKNLVSTMRVKNGVGIAAPQVDVLKRVFVIEIEDNPRYPNRVNFPIVIAINPEIEVISDQKIDSWEGCLSIPGIRGQLKRHQKIRLKALNEDGENFELELENFPAIVAQHELDHLNGVLFIDRMEDLKTLAFEEEYNSYWLGKSI